jgi:hypothetical protein
MSSAAGSPDSVRGGGARFFFKGDRRSSVLIGLLVALIFLAVWTPQHPALTQPPTGDVYTHLSVARHLCRGDGFVTDIAYPLSFAFPFARQLPQPLIHRDPGFPLLIALPHLAAGGDPVRVLAAARVLQLILLGAIIWIGTAVLLSRGRAMNVVPWLILLAANPMLHFAVNWIFVELACSLLLLVLWLRVRDNLPGDSGGQRKHETRDGILDGLLAGALALLRLDLFWVPILWWIALRWQNRRRVLLTLLILLLTMTPWAVRNLRLTGQPVFSVQSQAELVKGIAAWPAYTVYRQLEPQPIQKAVREHPEALLRKSASGVKYQLLNLHRVLPQWYWAGLGVLFLLGLAGRWHRWTRFMPRGPNLFRGGMVSQPLPLFVFGATVVMTIVQYSFFDHSMRHLFVLVPALIWELASWTGDTAVSFVERRLKQRRFAARGIVGVVVSVILTLAGIAFFPCTLPGWVGAAKFAEDSNFEVQASAEVARHSTDAVLFVEFTAIPYFADRPAVWEPSDPADRERIRQWLARENPPREANF